MFALAFLVLIVLIIGMSTSNAGSINSTSIDSSMDVHQENATLNSKQATNTIADGLQDAEKESNTNKKPNTGKQTTKNNTEKQANTHNEKSLKATPPQEALNLSTDDIECNINDKVNITVLTEPAGVTDGILCFYINQEIIAIHNLTYESPSYELDTSSCGVGTYDIDVDFSGSLTYRNAACSSKLTINKIPTSFGTLKAAYDENNDLNLSFTLLAKDNIINSGTMDVYHNNTLLKTAIISGENSYVTIPKEYNYEILSFAYAGSDIYDSMNASELIYVEKMDVDMYLPALHGYQGNIINANVQFYNSSPINDGYLDLYVDGILIDEYEVSSNKTSISIDLSGYGEGNYSVSAKYVDSNVYNNTTCNTTLQVNKVKTSIRVYNMTTYRNKPTNIKAYLYNYLDQSADGIVEFFIDGESIETTTPVDNIAAIEYLVPDNLDYGLHDLKAVYHGTQRYAACEGGAILDITKYSNKISLRNTSITPGGNIVLNIRSYCYGHDVDDGTISVYINGVLAKAVNVTSNNTEITLPEEYALNEDYGMVVKYENSSWYSDSSFEGTLHVDKTNTTTRVYSYQSNNALTSTAYVYSKNYDDVNNGTVEYYLNNNLIASGTIKNNSASITCNLTGYPEGTYELTVKYLGTNIYAPSTNTTTFARTIQQTRTYITANSRITANPSDTIAINATLNDYEGNPITETIPAKIIIGNNTTNTEFANGELCFTYKIPSDSAEQTSTIQVIANNTPYYKEATKNITLTVKKNTTYISAYSNIKTSKLGSLLINATLYSNQQILAEKTPAIIKINNKTIYSGYFIDGKVQYNLSLAKYTKDTYEIKVIAQQTTKFKESSKTINLTLNKRKTYIVSQNIYSEKGNKIIFNATIMDSITKQPIHGSSKACIKLNQITQNVTAIKDGHFVYEYQNNLSQKTYNITIIFGENQIYNSSKWEGQLINTKTNLKVSLNAINTKANSTINIKANLLDNNKLATETIKAAVKINGNTIKKLNVTNGQINFNYSLSDDYSGKTYNLTIVTGETGEYYYTQTTTSLTVTKTYRTITTTSINATKGDTVHIQAKIYNENGDLATLATPVNIKIGGKSIYTANATGGIIECDYKTDNLKKGYYDILIQAGETALYRHSTKHSTLRVL